MPDYKKLYFQLAAKVADAIEILLKSQQEGEKEYMNGEPSIIRVVTIKERKDDPE